MQKIRFGIARYLITALLLIGAHLINKMNKHYIAMIILAIGAFLLLIPELLAGIASFKKQINKIIIRQGSMVKNILIIFFMLSVIIACLSVMYFIYIRPNLNAMCCTAIYVLTAFLFVIHESKIPNQAISIMQLIGSAQNFMLKKPNNPIECFVILNTITGYFEKERTDIIYYTNILENKNYIKRKKGFENIEQFGLTEKGIEYFKRHELKEKKIKKF